MTNNTLSLILNKWSVVHLFKLFLILLWRIFPWPGGHGHYFFKSLLGKVCSESDPVPIWTQAGWLLLSNNGDILQQQLFFNGQHYETEVAALVKAQVAAGETFFDIGGHVGYFTMLSARKVGPQGKVVVFEPQPRLSSAIRMALVLNHISWAVVENKAVSDQTGTIELFQPVDTGRTSSSNILIEAADKLTVDAVALHDHIAKYGHPDWIKLDIEGGEWRAIQGMGDLLDILPRPKLIIEIHPDQLRALGDSPEILIDYLRQKNYQLKWIDLKKGLMDLPSELPQRSTWHLFAAPLNLSHD